MNTPTTPAEILAAARGSAIDPFPDAPASSAACEETTWYAFPGQWELGALHRMVREGFAGACDVEFAANYGALEPRVVFRARTTETGVRVQTTGQTSPVDSGPGAWSILVEAPASTPAGFAVTDGTLTDVEASIDGVHWAPADARTASDETPPHEQRNPIVPTPMRFDGELFALPAEAFGRVVVRSAVEPVVFAGESREEALAAGHVEQHHDMRRRAAGVWESVHELGLRYLLVRTPADAEVVVEARVHPLSRRGAFVCADERLTGIWAASAYTLRVCAQGLLMDGVKRDRMPWMGDTALGALGVAHAFGDGSLIERGLSALGRPRSGYVNGIVDYSLWWVITTAFHARYFDAAGYSRRNAEHLHRFVAGLASEAGIDGVLRPEPGPDAYAKPVFIDWQVDVDPDRDCTALQMLWYWALTAAADVLGSVGHSGAAGWAALAARLRETLLARAWDADTSTWREYLDDSRSDSPYPNLFAVLAGISPDRVGPGILGVLRDGPRVRTPFVAAFALSALACAGDPASAVERIRERWGAMLDAGATTFWEEFPEPDAGPYEMYGRPFGKSLCHAWAAGPAQLLPEIVCGIRPIGDAWSEFEVEPALGDLAWAACVTPVPGGEIAVIAAPDVVTVWVPEHHVLVRGGKRHVGPATVTLR